jgi:S1-C subfamily serine protease
MSEPRDEHEHVGDPGEVHGNQATPHPSYGGPPETTPPQQEYVTPGQWQPGWVPPPQMGSTGWGPGWTPPPQPKRRGLPVALTAVLVVAGAAAGAGIGHAVWDSHSSNNASQNSPQSLPNNNSNQNPFNGGEQNPYGNGNGFGGGNGNSNGNSNGNGSSSGGSSNASGGPSDVDSIAKKVNPALVDVNVTFGYQDAQGAGTGIVLTSNGEILTNNHVINGATSISVTDIGNGKSYSASVVGYDSTHDIAVLQLKNASGLKTAKIGNSSNVKAGQSVVAIGNAGGAGGTPSSAGGSVTALNQSITANDDLDGVSEQLTGLIETNANIQSGDSGGSLVNTDGKVVGVDTAASNQYSIQGSGGQGYAIPINAAMSIANKIEKGQGTSTIHVGSTAFLGVSVASDSNSQGNGQTGGSGTSGAQVAGVLNGGAAQAAGIAEGDVITSVDGKTISSSSGLSAALVGHHPGDKVTIGWTDTAGQTHSASVALRSGPPA